jgi:hypothetical protein
MMVGFELGRVAREREEGWESIQRMTEHRRRVSREGNRLHVAIPDESLKSQTVGWAWCLKSQVTFSLAPTHTVASTPSPVFSILHQLLSVERT